MFGVNCTMYTVYCILFIVHFTLYSVYSGNGIPCTAWVKKQQVAHSMLNRRACYMLNGNLKGT